MDVNIQKKIKDVVVASSSGKTAIALLNNMDINELNFVVLPNNRWTSGLINTNLLTEINTDNNFEMIRLLGKAAIGLTKKEYSDQLIEALQLLMLAYRSAGLLWAARASCAFLSASLVIEGEEASEARQYIPR